MKKWLGIIGIAAVLFFASFQVHAEDVLKAGRIYPYMPEITAELSGITDIQKEEISAMLGRESLSVETCHIYEKENDSSKIYVLVDVSTSMYERLDLLKAQLSSYLDQLGANDQVVLLTFGEHVTQVLSGPEDTAERKQVIAGLQPNEEGTVLFQALNQAYELSVSTQSTVDREYILLLTDGVDFQKGSETYSEIEGKFRGHILPIYTLCTENVTQEAADDLGELSRVSGGAFQMVYSGQEAQNFEAIRKKISQVYLLTLRASSNRISGEEELLQIQAAGKTVEQKIEVTRFIPDAVPPEIVKIEIGNENQKIIIRFSENVEYAQTGSTMRILDQNGSDVVVKKMEYAEKEMTAYVYVEEPLGAGEYKLVTQGITDMSQEKNPLKNDTETFIVNGVKGTGKKEIQRKYLIVGATAVLLFAAVIITLVVVFTKKKTRQEKMDNSVNNKLKLNLADGAGTVARDIYRVKQAEGRKLELYMKLADGSERRTTLHVVSSLIFGRGKNCDVVIEDPRMSRQHFAVELEDEQLSVVDLESVNGTKVNGVPVKARRPLKEKDRIQAGQTEIVIMR